MSADSISQNKLDPANDPELLKHIASLGLHTVAEYRQWCAAHGFSRRLNKHWRERGGERACFTRDIADAHVARKRLAARHPAKIIAGIFAGDIALAELTDPLLITIFRLSQLAQNWGATERFRQLLLHAQRHTELLDARAVVAQYGQRPGNTYLDALLALARQPLAWKRPLDAWRPRTHNVRRQFASLARHLYADWPVPAFMDAAWFTGDTYDARCQQAWFVHLGTGENIRTATLPITYTKRMAHQFMLAPADLTVDAALRWGQIQGLGGSERLCRAVIATRLGSSFENDEFWITVLRFLIDNPMLDLAQVGPIVDYIYAQKFEWTPIHGPGPRTAPQPNFTIKGRTPHSLLRQVEAWHRTLARTPTYQAEWQPSGVANFRFVEGTEHGSRRVWTITELLSTKALVAEGRALQHCVASYAHSCARRSCAIFTMEVEDSDGLRKVLTLEVHLPTKVICQARGKRNIEPGDKHRTLLRRWAEQSHLTLAGYV